MTSPLRLLALGDYDHDEFADAMNLLAGESFVQLTRGAAAAGTGAPIELVLVFQSWPGSVTPEPIEALRNRMPLAGMAVVLGTWCEGEMRTGTPLPHCERVFWYQFAPWWQTVRAAWLAGRPTPWQLPDRVEVEFSIPLDSKLVAIDSEDTDAADALLAACEAMGACGVWSPRFDARPLTSQTAAGIWVGAQLGASEEDQLARFRQSLPDNVPLVALLDFPRRDRVERAIELGATSVLGKPWKIEQLAAALGGLRTKAGA